MQLQSCVRGLPATSAVADTTQGTLWAGSSNGSGQVAKHYLAWCGSLAEVSRCQSSCADSMDPR